MAKIDKTIHFLQDKTPVTIRAAAISDAERLRYCVTQYISENSGQVWSPGEFAPSIKEEEKWISAMLDDPSKILMVAEVEGEIVGNIDFHIGARKHA